MKICVFADDFPPHAIGGAGAVAATVAQEYVQRGHGVTIITIVQNPVLAGSFRESNMRIERLYSNYHEHWRSWRSLYNPAAVSKVNRLLTEIRPDVVHVHNIHTHLSYYTLKLAKKSGAKVILTAHDCMLFHYGKFTEYINQNNLSIPSHFHYSISPWRQLRTYKKRYNPFRNIIIRHYLKYCDKICAVSYTLQEALTANGITNTTVVYNGINVAEWQEWQKRASNLRETKSLGQRPIIGFVGKMSGVKGAGQLRQALTEVQKQLPETILLVIGGEEHNKEPSIVATGRLSREDLVAAYEACTVVAFPSLCLDTFGMVNIEAMLTGKPVVATCFGGAQEVVVDGVTGVIVNPYNTKAFSEALLEFLTDPEKSERFGRAGRERVKKEFILDRQVEAYLALMTV